MDGKPDWLVYWVMQRVTKQAQGQGSKLVAVEHLLQELFHWFDGYDCTPQELSGLDNAVKPRGWIARQMVGPEASVYGEVLPEGVQAVLDEINTAMPLTAEDVFYDLGSGTGKVAIHAALVTPCRRVVGIELADTRHQHACRALKEAQNLMQREEATQASSCSKGGKSKAKQRSPAAAAAAEGPEGTSLLAELVRKWETKGLELIQGDITEASYKDGTHLFAASTTWPDTLLSAIAGNLCTKVPNVKTFSTLREIEDEDLEAHPEMSLWRKIKVDVSWTDSAEMHIYRFDLEGAKKKEKGETKKDK